jgi:hypothetical protein
MSRIEAAMLMYHRLKPVHSTFSMSVVVVAFEVVTRALQKRTGKKLYWSDLGRTPVSLLQ